jgi:hypothetical protein
MGPVVVTGTVGLSEATEGGEEAAGSSVGPRRRAAVVLKGLWRQWPQEGKC